MKPSRWRAFDRTLVIALLLMFLGFGIFGARVNSRTARLARQGVQAHLAICALRGDLERRVATSVVFLREHPQGVPGIDAATIRNSIVNQQMTISALDVVRCAG